MYAGRTRRTALLVFGTSTSFSILLPASRQGDLLAWAGGENVVEQKHGVLGGIYMPLSLEYAALKDPDHVFFVNHGRRDVMARKTEEALAVNSAWNTLRAVREGRAHVLAPELFVANPGLRTDCAVRYISDILYAGDEHGKSGKN
jgi:iron complex transport system substrate-binding protein